LHVNSRYWTLLFALAALWGASYLFIKVGLDDLSPPGVVFTRTALAALVLMPFAIASGGMAPLWRRAPSIAALAVVQVAGPFTLISAGERHIASSLAGILVASAPIFSAIIALWADSSERLSARGLAGVATGIVGVALLLGVDLGGSGTAFAAGVMVLAASCGYSLGGFILKRWFRGFPPLALVAATMSASAIMTLPLMLAHLPEHVGIDTVGAMCALGLGGTGVAFVIFYTLNDAVGPTRTSLVAYVAPVFSVVYGVTLLHEGFRATTAIGIVLIVGGSWLAARAPTRVADDAPVRARDARVAVEA
jgi:drug/metabolite transporter (DMT)-like permease